MGKPKDLSDFDMGQIVMAGWLGQSICRTASLVPCSSGGNVILWETLVPDIHVDATLTRTAYLKVDHVQSFMATVVPDGRCGQDNVPCHTAEIDQEQF